MTPGSHTLTTLATKTNGTMLPTQDGLLRQGWALPKAAANILSMQTRSQRVDLVLDRLCRDLNAELDMQIVRANIGLPTHDPKIMARLFAWDPAQGGTVDVKEHEVFSSEQFRTSPLPALYESGLGTRVEIHLNMPPKYGIENDLRDLGATDYIILPLIFTDGVSGHVSWATQREGGWTQDQADILHAMTSLLSLRCANESRMASLQAITRTYLGRLAAPKVLTGSVRKGMTDEFRACIWYCDLRGFTALSDTGSKRDTWELLDQYFSAVVPAITANGGDILKFIGDAVLAIFQIPTAQCERHVQLSALHAAQEAREQIDILNRRRKRLREPLIEAGIALHVGDVQFGNIGADDRLDFTAVGPAINEAVRMEGLCRPLGVPLIASQDFLQECPQASDHMKSIGMHTLRGVTKSRELFTDVGLLPPAEE